MMSFHPPIADEIPITKSRAKHKRFGLIVWNSANPRVQPIRWPPLLQHMSRTAPQEASDDPTARFVCPFGSCGEILSSSSTLQDLWSHASDGFHQKELCRQGLFRCELGCPVGFTDALGRLYHYSQQACGVEILQEYDCPYATCAGLPNETAYSRLQHWIHKHASKEYGSAGYVYMDEACEIVFPSKTVMQCHIWGGQTLSGSKSTGCVHHKTVVDKFTADHIITTE